MRPTLVAPFAAVALLALSPMAACTRAPDPERELSHQIHQGIELLEAHRDAEFLERFMRPQDRARLYPALDQDHKLERFRTTSADRLLQRLKASEHTKPTLSEKNTRATLPIQPPMHFVRMDGRWRIEN